MCVRHKVFNLTNKKCETLKILTNYNENYLKVKFKFRNKIFINNISKHNNKSD